MPSFIHLLYFLAPSLDFRLLFAGTEAKFESGLLLSQVPSHGTFEEPIQGPPGERQDIETLSKLTV